MKKFLVIGCGGSGGATLAYLMDHLGAILAPAEIPPGWQFLQIDAPTSNDSRPDGLPTVDEQGGRYLGIGPQTGSYAVLDDAVSRQLGTKVGLLAGWAAKHPEVVSVPISVGAGQFRAVGRMITVNKAGAVLDALRAAWSRLHQAETSAAMERLAQAMPELGAYSSQDAPIVLVVSSMAGGSGASMALDVCRLATMVTGLNPELVGVFMATADVFDVIPQDQRVGVRPNALAMLGEIVAAQTGVARQHDVALLAAMGQSTGVGEQVPFARVFPVSAQIGGHGAKIGQGRPNDVYRALGRGLAALMTSGPVALEDFVKFDLGNPTPPELNVEHFGWGAPNASRLSWHSFGYASLSTGRDRYEHYAAQRLARGAVDRLVEGHVPPAGTDLSATKALEVLLDSQWAHLVEMVRLPAAVGDLRQSAVGVSRWLTTVAVPSGPFEQSLRGSSEHGLVAFLPQGAGLDAAQWVPTIRTVLRDRRAALDASSRELAYGAVYQWHIRLLADTLTAVGEAVARFGLPFAASFVQRLEAYVTGTVRPALDDLAVHAGSNPTAVAADMEATFGGLRGVLSNGQAILDRLVEQVRWQMRIQGYGYVAGFVRDVLSGYVTDVLRPMHQELTGKLGDLEAARAGTGGGLGLANLDTTVYAAWPSDDDVRPAARFSHAENEVLLTSADDFPSRFEADLRNALGAAGTFVEARTAADAAVISGRWTTSGGVQPPGGLLEQIAPWHAAAFSTHPETGESLVPSRSRFVVHVTPGELLQRAKLFVQRPGEAFASFVQTSLRDYLLAKDETEAERADRRAQLLLKFRQTLDLARPLVSADATAVRTMHNTDRFYRYKFSAVPFRDLIADDLVRMVEADAEIDASSAGNLRGVTDDSAARQISVFGSYQHYSPYVFDTVTRPAAEQWQATAPAGRAGYWQWRRSRPLDAALPLSADERYAMVAGWFIGQVIGALRLPARDLEEPVEVYDFGSGRWEQFPSPLLTSPLSEDFQPFDWLPAVLESMLLAVARATNPPVMSSLRPYRALRELYDANPTGPVAGAGLSLRAAGRRLSSWADTGAVPPGGASRVPGAAVATTRSERIERAQRWLNGPRSRAEADFLGANAGDGVSGVQSPRDRAAHAPIFMALAPDVRRATDEIAALLAQGGPAVLEPEF